MKTAKVTKFDKRSLKTLRNDLDVLLEAYGEKTGLTIHCGGMRYTDTDVKVSVLALIAGELTREQKAVALYTPFEHGEEVYVVGLGTCIVESYHTKRRKYPFLVKTESGMGKLYKVAARNVKPTTESEEL